MTHITVITIVIENRFSIFLKKTDASQNILFFIGISTDFVPAVLIYWTLQIFQGHDLS
jgi:hypothetical protein